MSKVYPALLKQFTIRLKRSEKFWTSGDFLKSIYQISMEFWIANILFHKFFQTDIIFFDQFKVPTIKYGKRFAEFIGIMQREQTISRMCSLCTTQLPKPNLDHLDT